MSAREISGCVTDGTLQGPLRGLVVRLALDGAPAGESLTDENGRFSVPWSGTSPAAARLGAAGDSSSDGASQSVRVSVHDASRRLLVEARPGGGIEPGEALAVDLSVPADRVPDDGAEVTFLCGEPVRLTQAARLSSRGLRDAYTHLKHPHRDALNLDLVQRAFPSAAAREAPFAWGEVAEGRGASILRLLSERGETLEDLAGDDLPSAAPVRTFRGRRVQIKYTTDDAFPLDRVDAALPASDREYTLPGGVSLGWVRHRPTDIGPGQAEPVPAYVQRVALLADHVLDVLTRPPFGLLDPRGREPHLEIRIMHQQPFLASTRPGAAHVELAPDNSDEANLRALPYVAVLARGLPLRRRHPREGVARGLATRRGSIRRRSLHRCPRRRAGPWARRPRRAAALGFSDRRRGRAAQGDTLRGPSVALPGTAARLGARR